MATTAVWSWIFLAGYVGLMMFLGTVGMRRVHTGDDFAVARSSYGPLFLAFAMAGTTASGATFVGIPGLAYKSGLSMMWYALLYPAAIYAGMFMVMRAVTRTGHLFGNRSVPEFLGDRYQSETLRLIVAVFSLMLVFYITGQLVAGLVMFERLMGLSEVPALLITGVVLMIYLGLGGAHADILTDAVQGVLMLCLAVFSIWLFATGFGIDGGFDGMIARLESLDPNLLHSQNENASITFGAWALFALVAAHLPFGMLPHIGNKLWALNDQRARYQFITFSAAFGLTLPMMALAGILARAHLGDSLLDGSGANEAIPSLYLQIFPPIVAAFLNVGILAAVMSTADGLVISASQVFANDIYRRSIAPRLHANAPAGRVDAITLTISRVSTVAIMAASMVLAYFLIDHNIALLIWIGAGGMIGAFAGPIMVGLFWRRTSASGAIAGFLVGAAVFVVLKANWLAAVGSDSALPALDWLIRQSPNPFACATLAEACSIAATIVVSLLTRPLPAAHLERVFGDGEAVEAVTATP